MREYLSEGLILNSQNSGAYDLRISLFTKKFGKIKAKVKSGRKITSKLVSHVQPGYFSSVRLIEKKGLQLVDALKRDASIICVSDLTVLDSILPEFQPEPELWDHLREESFSWKEILKLIGWDPEKAGCEMCEKAWPEYFNPSNQHFFCSLCASKIRNNELLFIYPKHPIVDAKESKTS